jgi:hypothetical protein
MYQSRVEVLSCLRLANILFGSIDLTSPLEPFNLEILLSAKYLYKSIHTLLFKKYFYQNGFIYQNKGSIETTPSLSQLEASLDKIWSNIKNINHE